MDILQQRILEIALQIPGYLGYEAKDRRRDIDKHTRGQLARKYGEMDTYLARVQKKAPLEAIVDLENLDQKMQRLIARFDTAPTGYAGWFDSAQIAEEDIDALTQFDATLANGVPTVKTAIDKIAAALKSKQGIDDAIGACAELLDTLNAQFDQREQFLATGKKPSLSLLQPRPIESPLTALEKIQPPDAQFLALANLKLNDAVSFDNIDYLVAGKITYTLDQGSFYALLLQDAGNQFWLRVGPANEIAACQEVELDVPSEWPESFVYKEISYPLDHAGTAKVSVQGVGGVKRSSVNFACYARATERLWVENYGSDARAMLGSLIDASDLLVYRK